MTRSTPTARSESAQVGTYPGALPPPILDGGGRLQGELAKMAGHPVQSEWDPDWLPRTLKFSMDAKL